jgi:eukaryotic-like serine/threonine-protein kinase
MGVVWRARDLLLGREVAVKEVAFPAAMPEAERHAAQARVTREARAAARLSHQGVVTLYDVVTHPGGVVMVMELVEAPTLADLVRAEGPLAPERVAEIGAQLAGALEAAHRVGIAHGDVRPGNVLVPPAGPVKLADFGVAPLVGEPAGPAADFWALGATLYFAVEGRPPFDDGAASATLAATVTEAPRPMRRAGPLAPLITALLAEDPAARPSGPKVRAWLAWLLVVAARAPGWEPAGEPAPVRRASPPVLPPAPPVPRRGGRRLLGVVTLLLVGGLLAAWLTGSIGADPAVERAAPATTGRDAGADQGDDQAERALGGSGADVAPTTRPVPATTRRPVTTRAPAAPTTAAARPGLPAGWRAFTNRAGNHRVGVPPGFRARTRQRYHATVIEEQDGPGRVVTVRSQHPSAPLPQASRDYRAWARRNLGGFGEVRYAEGRTYAGRRGAVVFEYVAVRDGRRVHVRHVNLKGRTWGYNVEFIVPAGQWDASLDLARQFEQAFQPLG